MPRKVVLSKKALREAVELLRDTNMSHEEIGKKVGISTLQVASLNDGNLSKENKDKIKDMVEWYPVRKKGLEDDGWTNEEAIEEIGKTINILRDIFEKEYKESEKRRKAEEKAEKKKRL